MTWQYSTAVEISLTQSQYHLHDLTCRFVGLLAVGFDFNKGLFVTTLSFCDSETHTRAHIVLSCSRAHTLCYHVVEVQSFVHCLFLLLVGKGV